MSKLKAQPLPHSWKLSDWPPTVVPNRQGPARNLVRKHRAELFACGALVRIGRDITIIGEGFAVFLARKAARVEGFELEPNKRRRERAAAAQATTP